MLDFIHIGYGNLVNETRIVAVEPKRGSQLESNFYAERYTNGLVLDMAHGRKANSVIVMDTGHHILSAVFPDELQERREKVVELKEVKYDAA